MQWNAWDILRLICWSRCISIFSEMSRQKLQTKWMIILMIFWNNRVSFLIMTFILGSNSSFSASMKPYSKQIARLARAVQSLCYIWDCILTLPQHFSVGTFSAAATRILLWVLPPIRTFAERSQELPARSSYLSISLDISYRYQAECFPLKKENTDVDVIPLFSRLHSRHTRSFHGEVLRTR